METCNTAELVELYRTPNPPLFSWRSTILLLQATRPLKDLGVDFTYCDIAPSPLNILPLYVLFHFFIAFSSWNKKTRSYLWFWILMYSSPLHLPFFFSSRLYILFPCLFYISLLLPTLTLPSPYFILLYRFITKALLLTLSRWGVSFVACLSWWWHPGQGRYEKKIVFCMCVPTAPCVFSENMHIYNKWKV